MEAPSLPTSDAQDWVERFSRSLQQQRERIREFLAAQQERLGRVEAELAGQVHRIANDLAQNRDETRQATDQVQQRCEQLAREREEFDSANNEWEAKQAQWEQLQQQAAGQQEAVLSQIQRQQEELDGRWKELLERQPQIEEAEAQVRHDREVLEAARKELEAERERFHADPDGHDAAKYEEIQRQLEAERRRAEQLQRELDERPTVPTDGESGDDDHRRRYEMALEDINELKSEKAELQRQLAAAQQRRGPEAAEASASGGALDWEAQKRQMLASLESDYDAEDEEEAAEKLKIEEVIQTTEYSLSEKDREIQELKHLLEDQSGNLDSMAVGAAALGEMLDQDAIVKEERERLKVIQDEWREKLRKAEVDISVERAKIARERAEIEEKLRVFEQRGGQDSDDGGRPEKPARGRWLERLGLKDSEGE